jgi:anti-sigma regulatory factor (Ser/Thr protein kinase)
MTPPVGRGAAGARSGSAMVAWVSFCTGDPRPGPAPPRARPGMTAAATPLPRPHTHAFRHEALLYAGAHEFLAATVPFLFEAVDAGEAALVVVDGDKIAMLEEALGPAAEAVHFADMAEVGRNPARIIPAWHDFVSRYAGGRRPFRGIGEPVGAERSTHEMEECQRHESLLNVAFDRGAPWWLLCPYDTSTVGAGVIEEACRRHPFVTRVGRTAERTQFRPPTQTDMLGGDLPESPDDAEELTFHAGPLLGVRDLVAARAAAFGLDAGRSDDLVVAVNEIASNSVRHGGGWGTLLVWADGERLVCEVRDRGRIRDPLVGRHRPSANQSGGRGVWIANQLCDLVQVRSSTAGTVVRLHMVRG